MKDGLYVIEKIIRKDKNKYFIKWRNYLNDFNSWIIKNDIVKHIKIYVILYVIKNHKFEKI